MAKQIVGVSIKGEEEALYANKGRLNSKQHVAVGSKINESKEKKIIKAKGVLVQGEL